jgi:hypothetical protein
MTRARDEGLIAGIGLSTGWPAGQIGELQIWNR